MIYLRNLLFILFFFNLLNGNSKTTESIVHADRLEGSSCEDPYWITLPLENFEGDTEPMGNNYSNNMIAPSSYYLNGNDMVFKFTVAESGLLFGNMTASDAYIGLFIMQDCPDPDNPALLTGWSTSYLNTLTIPSDNPNQPQEIMLLPGDYFLIVSSYPPPETITFTLNLWLEPLTDCPQPILPTATDITISSAALGWTETGEASQWDILYGETGFDPETEGTLIEGITQNPYSLTGLTANNSYDFYVRSVCDENMASEWTAPETFTTECDFAFSTTFSEGFELENAPPECWQMWYENPDPPTENLMTHSTDESYSGERSFKFSSWVSGPPYTQFLRSPELDFEDSLQVSFTYFGVSDAQEVIFSVGYSDDGVAWAWMPDVTDAGDTWKNYSVNLPSETKYACIQYKGSFMRHLYIDEFSATPVLYPEISVNPGEFYFALSPGNTATDELILYNDGGADLQYSVLIQEGLTGIGDNQKIQNTWLSVTPEQGSVQAGNNEILNLLAEPDGMSPGLYQSQIVINSNDPENPEILIPVTLDIVTGFHENSLQKVKVFPVPATDHLSISSEIKMVFVDIINTTGQLIIRIDAKKQHNLNISTEKFSPGIYQLRMLYDNGNIISKQLIIQKR